MNIRTILHYLGLVFRLEAVFLLLPLAVSLYHGERAEIRAFAVTAMALLGLGTLLAILLGAKRRPVRSREGFLLVALCWIVMAICGAFPYWISGSVGGFADCVFESISGFTTTAASVVADVESLPRGILFWRGLSLWIGGMGVLVLLLAVTAEDGGVINVMRAESPGPTPGKLVPRLRQSAMILYGIYLGLTLLEILLLALGGMPLFDSVVTSMATAGTGGFTMRSDSIAGYDSLYTECVIMAFMFLCGVNYHIHYFLLVRKLSAVKQSDEWKVYAGILAASTAIVTANLVLSGGQRPAPALRAASFQVLSVMTTTGFSTADVSLWPELSKILLFLLMFVGACAGSSGGGLKVARVIVLAREAKRVLYRMLHPRLVGVVRLDGKRLEPAAVHGVCNYLAIYLLVYFLSLLIISLDNLDFETTFTAAAACLNNVGAGMGLVSVTGRYAQFSTLSKMVLAFDMLAGRLELYPLLLLLSRRAWRSV